MTPSQMAQEVRAFIEKTTRYADAWGVAKAVKARFSYIVASWVEFGSNGVQNVWCRFKDDIKSVFDLSEIIANAGQLKFA